MEAPGPDPLVILTIWHADAARHGAREPDAMSLATATRDGRPAVRLVLFKGVVEGRVQFVTNYTSRKAREIEQNPAVALSFFWAETARQVRVEGRAEKAPIAISEAYFRTRPRESQLGAWASPQSEPIESRAELEARYAAAEARFEGRQVDRPSTWGVYWVIPEQVELWVAGAHRLHDRFLYTRRDGSWSCVRLSP